MVFEGVGGRTVVLIEDKPADKGAVAAFTTVPGVVGKRYCGRGVISF
jgi:hypothetical protein